MKAPRSPITRRHALLALAGACALPKTAMSTAMTTAMPAEVSFGLKQAQLQGRANLRYFGFLVYEARLWTPPGFDAQRYDAHPFALELEYARKLDGSAIAERSIAEMKRVGDFSETQAKAWLALMMQAFPNVGAQDRLTGLHDGKGGVRFFFNGKQTANINDKDYARLFFGIWLSTKTTAPGLRAELIGQS